MRVGPTSACCTTKPPSTARSGSVDGGPVDGVGRAPPDGVETGGEVTPGADASLFDCEFELIVYPTTPETSSSSATAIAPAMIGPRRRRGTYPSRGVVFVRSRAAVSARHRSRRDRCRRPGISRRARSRARPSSGPTGWSRPSTTAPSSTGTAPPSTDPHTNRAASRPRTATPAAGVRLTDRSARDPGFRRSSRSGGRMRVHASP